MRNSVIGHHISMTVIITLFYLSLATIIGMVVWKLISLREFKLSLIEGIEKDLHGKLYESIDALWHLLQAKYFARAYALVLALFYTIAHEVLRRTLILGQKIKTRHLKLFNMVKGKGVIRKKGSVSFFLRDVAEYKESLKAEKL